MRSECCRRGLLISDTAALRASAASRCCCPISHILVVQRATGCEAMLSYASQPARPAQWGHTASAPSVLRLQQQPQASIPGTLCGSEDGCHGEVQERHGNMPAGAYSISAINFCAGKLSLQVCTAQSVERTAMRLPPGSFRYLYVSEAFNKGGIPVSNKVLRFTLKPDGTLGDKSVFKDFGAEGSAYSDVDGMRTDTAGKRGP